MLRSSRLRCLVIWFWVRILFLVCGFPPFYCALTCWRESILPLFYKATNSIMKTAPWCPHLSSVISVQPYLVISHIREKGFNILILGRNIIQSITSKLSKSLKPKGAFFNCYINSLMFLSREPWEMRVLGVWLTRSWLFCSILPFCIFSTHLATCYGYILHTDLQIFPELLWLI